MSKHSPGPWRWDGETQDEKGRPVAGSRRLLDASGGDLLAGWAELIHDADARLIAAAPELLEALKKAVSSTAEEARILGRQPEDSDDYRQWSALISRIEDGE